MPIGDYYAIISKKPLGKFIYRLFGTLDLHTHIRLREVMHFFQDYLDQFSNIKILELGCGSGVNAFEIYKIACKKHTHLNYTGVDLSFEEIKTANSFLQVFLNMKAEISFYQEDAINFLKRHKDLKERADIILMADIIEHIKDPQKLISFSAEYLKNNGFFVVSVPTPLYPKIFGRKFHNKIGHLRDGYSLDQLDELFHSVGCQRIMYKYNTGILSNVGCWLYYNKLNFNNGYINLLKQIILYPFKFLDFYNNLKTSCSLFAVYSKK